MNMLLEGKTAVVYGGGGKVGGAVARAFASEGARVFLAGRTIGTLDEVAEDIASAGELIPLVEMTREDFMRPISTGTSTHFLTARAAAHGHTGLGRHPDVLRLVRPRVFSWCLCGGLRDRVHGDRSSHKAACG